MDKCTSENITRQNEIDKMSEINRTISERANSSFKKWKKYDSNMNFCDIDQEHDENMVFIDLLKVSNIKHHQRLKLI